MANYTKKYSKPYADGYKDRPDTSTPVTAAIKNMETEALLSIEEYLSQLESVSIDGALSKGYSIATITINGETFDLNIPELSYTSTITGGTKIGQITLGERSYDLYAPAASAGGSSVSVMTKTTEGTNIAEITVDGTTYQLYAPAGGSGSGSTVTAEAMLEEGTAIGKITIDGVETTLYAPKTASVTVDAELSAESENPIQNKAVDAAVKNLQKQIDAGGSGSSVTVDDTLSSISENPVQNKVITEALADKIETADTEESPDFVNFDLDAELSETSIKGVQNKAVAKEFKAYADGTKAVAKAAEADAATKASQDGDGNNIATTYAKKTEIPEGGSVSNMTSDSNGVGRPDGKTIVVVGDGIFKLNDPEDIGVNQYIYDNTEYTSIFSEYHCFKIGNIALLQIKCFLAQDIPTSKDYVTLFSAYDGSDMKTYFKPDTIIVGVVKHITDDYKIEWNSCKIEWNRYGIHLDSEGSDIYKNGDEIYCSGFSVLD